MYYLIVVLSYLVAILTWPVAIVKFLYEIFKLDVPFWSSLISNGLGGVVIFIIAVVFIILFGRLQFEKSSKKLLSRTNRWH
ncbi:hypothetical protein Erwinia_phage_Rouille_00099 [Erwinia phage Rouille]|uniref:Gp090 n=1 Tax=Erwinia phage vB_Eam-MM7 TaxID=1051674 RepID=G0YPS2_9CAUD|nr:gp090 [Erwinia phage vB_Eam-MM7]AEJ81349.1 gp090 [Erwinia phage vB_Eam-MM7]UNA01063.1 hypothetical protein 1Hena2_00113 [Erwinia phage Hena2]WJN64855.1 hypothetical protein Erwinia_phage_Rouille_00099 [Erwinia phage Rouille]